MPRPKLNIWSSFIEIKSKNKGKWARCRKCLKEMQGIPSRMQNHFNQCQKTPSQDNETNNLTTEMAYDGADSNDVLITTQVEQGRE